MGGGASGVDGWCTVAVTVAEGLAELAADVLWHHGAPAVEERPAPGPGEVLLLAGYADRATAATAADAVRTAGLGDATVSPVVDDGLDAWRDHARPERAGPFTVVPAWLEHRPEGGEIVLLVDPGRTFGSGSHPTTRLVLEELADRVERGHRVLDVGTGSGILAVAAALLGAEVTALDVDPGSARVTRANAERNGVAERIRYDDRPLSALAGECRSGAPPFDVVAANLLAPVLVDLAPDLGAVVRPGGCLVVSGLLADRWEPAVAELEGRGELRTLDRRTAEGWTAVTLTRDGS